MWDLKACRCCLATEPKLEKISEILSRLYCTVTGLMFNPGDGYPNYFCVECHTHLKKCLGFRRKSRQAFSTLQTIMNAKKQITIEDIQEIQNTSLFSAVTEPTFKNYDPSFTDHVYIIDINREKPEFPTEPIELDSQPIIEEEVPIQDETDKEEIPIDMDDVFKDLGDDNINNDDDESDATNLNEEFQDNNSDEEDATEDVDKNETALNKKQSVKTLEKNIVKPQRLNERKKNLEEKIFTIIKLSLEEQKEDLLKRQDSLNFKNSPLKCMDCYKGFLDEKTYSAHRLRHSDEFGSFACSICNMHFKTHLKANRHKVSTHANKYCCNQCSFITSHRESAKQHEGWHSGKRYQCPQCSEVFNKSTTYMGHLKRRHPSDFVCELCGYAFISARGIQLHKELKHVSSEKVPEDGPYCESCDVRFISEDAFNTHLHEAARHKNDSNQNRPPARHPVKSVRRKQSYDAQDRLTCEQCGKQLRGFRAYHFHFMTMHPNKNRTLYPSKKPPRMCDKCGKIFPCYAQLKDHLHSHTNESGFKCPQCEKTFIMKSYLQSHLNTHKKERFPCDICGKNFSNISNRLRHMIIHTGLRPHKCDMCSKTFKTNTEKKVHITYFHLKKPWPKRTRRRASGKQGHNMQSTQGVSETDSD